MVSRVGPSARGETTQRGRSRLACDRALLARVDAARRFVTCPFPPEPDPVRVVRAVPAGFPEPFPPVAREAGLSSPRAAARRSCLSSSRLTRAAAANAVDTRASASSKISALRKVRVFDDEEAERFPADSMLADA